MKKILITGSNGFIGKNLSEGLMNNYKLYTPKRNVLNLLDTELVEKYLKENEFNVIIHCANQNATRDTSVSNYEILNRNLTMFFNLERCKDYYERMYYFGSGAEYDMNNYVPMMKEDYFGKFIPTDPYGFSKYVMSKAVEQNNNIYDLRLFGVFGKYEEWEHRFISNAICRCIYNLSITINQNVYFDYLYIQDLIEIMKWFIENKPKMKHYNVCTGKRIDLLTIAKKVIKISNKKLNILIKKNGLKKEYTGNNSLLLDEIGDITFTDLDMSIKSLYKYYVYYKKSISVEKLV
ncbi:NAD-dependent epimerase/dehydratase family protein [Clostridium sp. LBM24168]